MKLSIAGGVVLWAAEVVAGLKGAETMKTYLVTTPNHENLGTIQASDRLEALEGMYADMSVAPQFKYPSHIRLRELQHRHCPVYCVDSAKCDEEEDGVYCTRCGYTVGPCLQQATQDYYMCDDNYVCDLCLVECNQ